MASLRFRSCASTSVFLAQLGLMACGGGAAPERVDPAGGGGKTSGSAGAPVAGGAGGSGQTPSGGAATASMAGAANSSGGAVASGGVASTSGGALSGGGTAPATGGAGNGAGAPETIPLGYGQHTTGGGKVKATSAATLDELQAAVDDYSGSGGLVLKYTGKFEFSKISDPCVQHTLPGHALQIKGKSDITLEGDDGSAANFGVHVAGDSSNVIIRNMTIGLTPGGDDSDIVSLEGTSAGVPHDIWIDHNEFFTSMAECEGAGDTAFDGMIDVKKGADNVSVSYNYLHDHHKLSLNGYSDTDDAVRHITFDHNFFENLGSRTPLQRHGFAHLLNNYFSKVTVSGINVRMGGYALVEANYFETVENPVTARDSSEVGFWELRGNNLATAADVAPGNGFGITWSAGNAGTVNATDWKTTAAYPEALGYDYQAQSFQCVHDGLRATVGASKGLPTLKCK
jgi:pectate lyase